MKDKFVIMRHWLDKAEEACSDEQFDRLSGAIIRYGLYGQEIEIDDSTVKVLFLFIKDQIDRMQEEYEKKAVFNKGLAGRRSTFSKEENEIIYEFARRGMKVKEIAAQLGIVDEKKIKAIYNSDGWKRRKE